MARKKTSRATKQKLRAAARKRFAEVVIPRRDAKRLLEGRLRAIRVEIKQLRKQEQAQLRKIRSGCSRSRTRALARAKARRAELLAQARREARELLDAARRACTRNLTAVERRTMSAVEQLRDESERRRNRYLQDWGRRKGGVEAIVARDRKAIEARVRRERAQEADHEVEANIAPELVPIWRQVRKRFKASDKLSRTEAFEHWVEENPEEVATMLVDAGEEQWRDELRERERLERMITKLMTKGELRWADLEEAGITERDLEHAGLGDVLRYAT